MHDSPLRAPTARGVDPRRGSLTERPPPGPRLVGRDSRLVEAIRRDLYAATRATTVGAITSLAPASVDTAPWDLKCRRAGESLWRVAGGFRSRVPLYNTEGGWLHLTSEELVEGAKAAAATGGVKVKISKPDAGEDLERLMAVREAAGPRFDLMVDANQSMTAAEAIRRAAAFGPLDLCWLEEPLPADDVAGHVSLAAAIPNGRYVEHIPQLRAITRTEMTVENGHDAIRPPGKRVAGRFRRKSDFVHLVSHHPSGNQQPAGAFRDGRTESVGHKIAGHEPERSAARTVCDHPVPVPLTGEAADRHPLSEEDPVPLAEAAGRREIATGRGRGHDRQTQQRKHSNRENCQFPSHDHSSARRTPNVVKPRSAEELPAIHRASERRAAHRHHAAPSGLARDPGRMADGRAIPQRLTQTRFRPEFFAS